MKKHSIIVIPLLLSLLLAACGEPTAVPSDTGQASSAPQTTASVSDSVSSGQSVQLESAPPTASNSRQTTDSKPSQAATSSKKTPVSSVSKPSNVPSSNKPSTPTEQTNSKIDRIFGQGNGKYREIKEWKNGDILAVRQSNSGKMILELISKKEKKAKELFSANTNDMTIAVCSNGDYLLTYDQTLARYSSSHKLLWKTTLQSDYILTEILELKNGEILCYAYQTVSNGLPDDGNQLLLYRADGTLLIAQQESWSFSDGGYPFFTATQDGGFAVAFGSSAGQDEISKHCTNGNDDAFLAKYSADLQLQWVKVLGGSGIDEFITVTEAENGDLYAVCATSSNDFKDDKLNVNPVTRARLLVRYDKNGNQISAFPICDAATGVGDISVIHPSKDTVTIVGWCYLIAPLFKDAKVEGAYDPDSVGQEEMGLYYATFSNKGSRTQLHLLAMDINSSPNCGLVHSDGTIVLSGQYQDGNALPVLTILKW